MTTIYYDKDSDPELLAAETVAVVGYGNQGRSWALNLRDSGCEPVVCVRQDATREQAAADGFSVHEVAEAGEADVICILVPDDVVPLLDVRPGPASCVIVPTMLRRPGKRIAGQLTLRTAARDCGGTSVRSKSPA